METTTNYGKAPGATVDRLAQGAHQTIDKVAARTGDAVETARARAGDLAEQFSGKIDELGAMQDEYLEVARDYIRAHPLATVGIAVVAALMIGRALR
jgi:ElaB/YqjD/DUF883 family membrane-anchored ribosome-binding protein